jgi:Sigma-70, region 4
MALETLPPDQRAVLQLVLAQGRTYDQLATVLRISPEAVRDRARAGALTLVPEGAQGLEGDARGRAVDYLLGQQEEAAERDTRADLGADPELRAWTLSLASALAPISPHPLPAVPEPADGAGAAAAADPDDDSASLVQAVPDDADATPVPVASLASEHGDEEAPDPAAQPDHIAARRRDPPAAADDDGGTEPDEPEGERPRRSLLGGGLLLAGLAVLVVVLVVALTHPDPGKSGNASPSGSGTSSSTPTTSTATTPTTSTPTTATNSTETQTLGQANLQPAQPGSKALAVAQLRVQGNSAGFEITAQGLSTAPNTYHAVWLEGTGREKTQFLGAVLNKDIKSGRFQRLAPVPSNVTAFNRMVISREPITSSTDPPKVPTTVELAGPLRLVGTG